jgi:FKBP-type peptidyl-prolyl cis-trans isomerase FklB
MKHGIVIVLLFVSGLVQAQQAKLKNADDTISYCLGINFAYGAKDAGITEIKPDIVAAAIVDLLEDEETLFTPEESNEILMKYLSELKNKQAEMNLKKGEEFLMENKTKPGVVELPSGLQYKILQEGTGESPDPHDKVTVHYEGKLVDGRVFDSSFERGKPAEFAVNRVIEGWTEALQLMKPGSEWMLYIPPDLAYGDNPRSGGIIEPNMVLVFRVKLLSVEEVEKQVGTSEDGGAAN